MDLKNDTPKVVVNPFLIYIGIGLAAAILQMLAPLPFLPAQPAKLMGVAILILNLVVGLPAVRGMLKAKTSPNPNRPTSSLVLTGTYRFSRNPMYVGLTLFFVGLAVFFQILWGILLTPIVIWLITIWVILPEEEYLERKFGSVYLGYKGTVRRWI